MYRTCLFCQGDLGANQSIEECPIGRRLAFDPAKGRLWVVCRRCERWNLTPFEERWEALEACERRYRGTRLRYSTANIGLARLAEGLELVRIGEPLRPELAAWRYGDQFGRRRRKHLLLSGLVLGGFSAAYAGSFLAIAAVGATGSMLVETSFMARHYLRNRRRVATVQGPAGESLPLKLGHIREIGLEGSVRDRTWHLTIPSDPMEPTVRPIRLSGETAIAALQQILPHINVGGGSSRTVRDAVTRLEMVPDPAEAIWMMATSPVTPWYGGGDHTLRHQPAAHRLALEMMLREAHEERAMRGELWRLEREWRQAEELAKIADTLLSSAADEEHLERLRQDPGSGQ